MYRDWQFNRFGKWFYDLVALAHVINWDSIYVTSQTRAYVYWDEDDQRIQGVSTSARWDTALMGGRRRNTLRNERENNNNKKKRLQPNRPITRSLLPRISLSVVLILGRYQGGRFGTLLAADTRGYVFELIYQWYFWPLAKVFPGRRRTTLNQPRSNLFVIARTRVSSIQWTVPPIEGIVRLGKFPTVRYWPFFFPDGLHWSSTDNIVANFEPLFVFHRANNSLPQLPMNLSSKFSPFLSMRGSVSLVIRSRFHAFIDDLVQHFGKKLRT